MHCLVKGLRCTTVFLLLIMVVFGTATAHTNVSAPPQNDFSGVIVHQLPIPSLLQRITRQAVYTASPSIVVLADGGYLIACNEFGHGSSAATSGLTHLYRSDDRGASWQPVATLSDMKRGSLWQHPDGSLYLLGFRAAPGDILIRRSVDGGHTWAEPDDESTGLLRRGTFGGTPNRPAIHVGRIWLAIGGRRMISAPVNADLLQADAWTLTPAARIEGSPLGENLTITEAQIVASDTLPPALLPKVGGHPYTVLIRSGDSPEEVRNPAKEDWVQLPGGEKKFAASWDPVSGYFIALTNPVLPAYVDSGWPPELIRNVGALLYSKDLREWQMAHIFIQSPHVDYEAFQYFSFDFDADDLVIASRTALQIDNRKPPRGHDSNLITFHRITGFRALLQ
jgi:hypothetical protein